MGKTTTTHPQQDEASFQEDGLWRKLLTRAQQGTTNHSFFVIDVVEGCLHTSMFCKLSLPNPFILNHCKSLSEHIILEGPDGHQWPTMLGRQLDSQPCLMHGWKEFAADYNLELKDQVVFLLFENSHFLVQVYDANNKVKSRVSASPENVNNTNSDMKVKSASQAGTQAHHSNVSSMFGFKTISEDNVIHILDSSEEEKEEEEAQVPLKPTKTDAPQIGCSSRKMTLRSAKKVDTEDHSLKDVSNRIKLSETFEKEQTQEHGKSEDDETNRIMDRILGKNNSSPDSPRISAPSSPEHVTVLKRSRRLQRKSGDYQGDDLGLATSVVRSRKICKLSQEVEKMPPRLYEDAKDACKRVPGSEILTSCCSTQQSTMKKQQKHFQQPQISTSKIAPAKITVLDATADPETTASGPELTAQERPGDRPVVKVRHKVKGSRDRVKKRTEEPCLSEDEANKRLARVGAPVKALNLLYISTRRPVTAQERQKTLEAAQSYASQCTNKHCVLQLRTSQVYCGFHLGVHPEFVEAMQLPFTRLKVTLEDGSGKKWEVEWLGDHPKRPGLHSAGWTKFVLEHYLEEGDVCVFQKSTVVNTVISVEIFPVVPLAAPPEHGWQSHYIVPSVARTVACNEMPDQSQS